MKMQEYWQRPKTKVYDKPEGSHMVSYRVFLDSDSSFLSLSSLSSSNEVMMYVMRTKFAATTATIAANVLLPNRFRKWKG